MTNFATSPLSASPTYPWSFPVGGSIEEFPNISLSDFLTIFLKYGQSTSFTDYLRPIYNQPLSIPVSSSE